jgi:hypothetical protein
MARKMDSRSKAQKDSSKAQARIDREEYFDSPGATVSGWMGGPHTVTRNKTRYRRKEKHRVRMD